MYGAISFLNDNQFISSTILSFLITIISCRLFRPLFVNLGFLDQPSSRSNHSVPIALGGGLIIIPITILIPFLLGFRWESFVILTLLILFCISIVDDYKSISAILRLLVHFFSIMIYVHFYLKYQLYIGEINKNIFIFLFYFISIISITWFINAFNFMDGIDGMTALKVTYLTSSLTFLNYFLGYDISVLSFSIVGVIIGFLFFNWSPASMFLGDAGSIPLGFLMIHFLLDLALKGYWVAALILPMYYIMDTSITLIIRLWCREKFWKAHSQHFYQKFARSRKSHTEVCYNVVILSLGLFLLALFSVISKNNNIFLILAIIWCTFFLLKFSYDKKVNL